MNVTQRKIVQFSSVPQDELQLLHNGNEINYDNYQIYNLHHPHEIFLASLYIFALCFQKKKKRPGIVMFEDLQPISAVYFADFPRVFSSVKRHFHLFHLFIVDDCQWKRLDRFVLQALTDVYPNFGVVIIICMHCEAFAYSTGFTVEYSNDLYSLWH